MNGGGIRGRIQALGVAKNKTLMRKVGKLYSEEDNSFPQTETRRLQIR